MGEFVVYTLGALGIFCPQTFYFQFDEIYNLFIVEI